MNNTTFAILILFAAIARTVYNYVKVLSRIEDLENRLQKLEKDAVKIVFTEKNEK
jgi:hypothetical protein